MNTTKAAPLAGVLGIAGVIAGLAMDNFPDGSMNDAAVSRWFDSHGTGLWMASGFAMALGGTVLLVFAAVIAARVEEAGAGPVARHLTGTAATAWAVLTMTGGALWLAVPVGVQFFDVKPNAALMALSGLPYAVLVTVCAFAAAMTAATLTTVSRQTGLLPRWLTRAGYPAAVLMLTNIFLPMAVITLYFVAVAVSLARRTSVANQVAAVRHGEPALLG
jgi:hypothetical protein